MGCSACGQKYRRSPNNDALIRKTSTPSQPKPDEEKTSSGVPVSNYRQALLKRYPIKKRKE